MGGLNHIILFFAEESVLGRKKTGELAGKGLYEQVAAMGKPTVSGCLIGQQSQPFPGKRSRGRPAQLFYS
jgi:hypothetical protein